MELKDMLKTLIELSKKTKYSTNTETYVYPIKNNIPRVFFNSLGFELINENDCLKVLEIHFDTLMIVFQGYDGDGENYDGVIIKKLNELSESLIKWCIDNIPIESWEQKIEELVEDGIDDIFCEAHQMANTKTGDITPSQMGTLNKIKGDLENLIKEQIKQNL